MSLFDDDNNLTPKEFTKKIFKELIIIGYYLVIFFGIVWLIFEAIKIINKLLGV